MKIKWKGRTYTFSPSFQANKKTQNKSQFHLRARQILSIKYSGYQIFEEVKLPGTRMFVDFYIPAFKMFVEVQGQQHDTYNNHFYENKLKFYKAKARDGEKKLWCEENGFTLVELWYNETDEEWNNKL